MPRPSQEEDEWGTTAKILLRNLGKENSSEILAISRTFRVGALKSKTRELARECGVPWKLFAAAVAIASVIDGDLPLLWSTLQGHQDTRKRDVSIRKNVKLAIDFRSTLH